MLDSLGRRRAGREVCDLELPPRVGSGSGPAPARLQRQRPMSWVADTTEFTSGEGTVFLAGVKDLCGRGLVGWSMGTRQTSELVIEAVSTAVTPAGIR